jgi:hypothetical protein
VTPGRGVIPYRWLVQVSVPDAVAVELAMFDLPFALSEAPTCCPLATGRSRQAIYSGLWETSFDAGLVRAVAQKEIETANALLAADSPLNGSITLEGTVWRLPTGATSTCLAYAFASGISLSLSTATAVGSAIGALA